MAIQRSWKSHCGVTCGMFVPFLTAPEGSTVCTHAVNCMPLWPAPLKSIHCYSSPPSMSLCLSERYMFWLMIRDALWGTSAMKTWTMNHQGRQHKNTLHCVSTFLHSLCLSFPRTMMCSDICDSGIGEEQKHCWLSVWLNGWWQSISSQLSGSDTVSGDQSPICDG